MTLGAWGYESGESMIPGHYFYVAVLHWGQEVHVRAKTRCPPQSLDHPAEPLLVSGVFSRLTLHVMGLLTCRLYRNFFRGAYV